MTIFSSAQQTVQNFTKTKTSSVSTTLTEDLVNGTELSTGVTVSSDSLVSGLLSSTTSTVSDLESDAESTISSVLSTGSITSSIGSEVLSNGSLTSISSVAGLTGLVSSNTLSSVTSLLSSSSTSSTTSGTSTSSTSTTGSVSSGATSTNTVVYTYPKDLPSKGGRFTMYFQKYSRDNVEDTPTYSELSSITFPVPSQLNEYYSVEFAEFNAGAWKTLGMADSAGELLSDVGNDISSMGSSGLFGGIKNIGSSVGAFNGRLATSLHDSNLNNPGAFGRAILGMNLAGAGSAAENLIPHLQNLINNYTGNIVNPSTTVSLQNVKLREHTFSWTFSPRNSDESTILYKIRDLIKKYELPTAQSSSNFLLNYPMICFPKIYLGEDNIELYEFKPCFISSFAFNHAGGGTPSFQMGDWTGTIVQLAIKLKEVEIFYNESDESSNSSSSSESTSDEEDDESSVTG